MTIKEAESRTGLARANIRYYEDQGFFSAARGENGYRDYSEEDVDTLLKVKLLRQLGFSLDEIRALQKGEQALGSALERREAGLERERRALDQAAMLCRDMRKDGADFYTLDARRYLDRLARAEEILDKDRDPVRIFPWRRLFARDLDLALYRALIVLLLQLSTRLNLLRLIEDAGDRFLLTIGGLIVMAAAETVMLHRWGTTPGKALLGLKVLREDGTPLGLEEAYRRTLRVTVFFGAGLLLAQIPIVLFALISLGMDIWACWQVYQEKPLFWEEDQIYLDGSTRERTFWSNRRNWLRIPAYLAAWAACIGLMIGGHLLAACPPHRGTDLTAEQFVDNYNSFMEFTYGRENLARELTVDGTFQDIEHEYTVIIYGCQEDRVPQPSFRFVEEDGRLTEVALVQRYDGDKILRESQSYAISLPYNEIYVAMRSFLWGRLGEKEIGALFEQLAEGGRSLHCERDGVRVDSEMRFSGYDDWGGGTLLAKGGQKQSYFVELTMTLTG